MKNDDTKLEVEPAKETVWTKVFDAESEKHYFWNEITDETTWDVPDGFVFSDEEQEAANQEKKDAEGGDATKTEEFKSYEASAYFNNKTGKFKNVEFDPKFKPDAYFNAEEKGTRQMSSFFDIARHNEESTVEKRRRKNEDAKPLSKKELQGFKKKTADKKRANIVKKYTDKG